MPEFAAVARRLLVRWAMVYFSIVLVSNVVDLVMPGSDGAPFDLPQDLLYWAVAVFAGVVVWELVRPARRDED